EVTYGLKGARASRVPFTWSVPPPLPSEPLSSILPCCEPTAESVKRPIVGPGDRKSWTSMSSGFSWVEKKGFTVRSRTPTQPRARTSDPTVALTVRGGVDAAGAGGFGGAGAAAGLSGGRSRPSAVRVSCTYGSSSRTAPRVTVTGAGEGAGGVPGR